MQIIGITGSIGCGKTFLASQIKKIGYYVYNPDEWTRDLYKKADFLQIIKEKFPQAFINGQFNKRNLRNIVFNDSKKLKLLESIIHPFLRRKLKDIIRKQAKKSEYLFLDVALLYEMNWADYCDYVIVVDVPYEVQKQRVMQRDNITEEDFIKIDKVQMPQSEKKKKADIVFNTDISENIVRVNIIKLIEELR